MLAGVLNELSRYSIYQFPEINSISSHYLKFKPHYNSIMVHITSWNKTEPATTIIYKSKLQIINSYVPKEIESSSPLQQIHRTQEIYSIVQIEMKEVPTT